MDSLKPLVTKREPLYNRTCEVMSTDLAMKAYADFLFSYHGSRHHKKSVSWETIFLLVYIYLHRRPSQHQVATAWQLEAVPLNVPLSNQGFVLLINHTCVYVYVCMNVHMSVCLYGLQTILCEDLLVYKSLIVRT